jgi:hypothetical protein
MRSRAKSNSSDKSNSPTTSASTSNQEPYNEKLSRLKNLLEE